MNGENRRSIFIERHRADRTAGGADVVHGFEECRRAFGPSAGRHKRFPDDEQRRVGICRMESGIARLLLSAYRTCRIPARGVYADLFFPVTGSKPSSVHCWVQRFCHSSQLLNCSKKRTGLLPASPVDGVHIWFDLNEIGAYSGALSAARTCARSCRRLPRTPDVLRLRCSLSPPRSMANWEVQRDSESWSIVGQYDARAMEVANGGD